ncbi:hypothetical protein IF2G_05309 [Cordyceps javanica]|nr:hypothetical protein IF2G_05309 [Cordyceps javanica]
MTTSPTSPICFALLFLGDCLRTHRTFDKSTRHTFDTHTNTRHTVHGKSAASTCLLQQLGQVPVDLCLSAPGAPSTPMPCKIHSHTQCRPRKRGILAANETDQNGCLTRRVPGNKYLQETIIQYPYGALLPYLPVLILGYGYLISYLPIYSVLLA